MSREFVSVITPTYNRRNFLPILIHLFKQQTYPAELRELVILDDSTTSNEDIIPKDDPSIRYYYSPERIVLGDKRNKLNELAKGDIIICFDDDDYHYPERISHSIFKLNSEKCNIAGCTILDIFYTDIEKIYTFGPYKNNHGTNGTFAYRREYIKEHKHDPTKHAQEEASFTNNYSEKLVQLNKDKVIVCIAHDSNTFDKKKLLTQLKQDTGFNMKKKFNNDKIYLNFLKELIIEMKSKNTIQT